METHKKPAQLLCLGRDKPALSFGAQMAAFQKTDTVVRGRGTVLHQGEGHTLMKGKNVIVLGDVFDLAFI